MGDLNCKIGTERIKNNTDELSKGGRVLLSLCKKLDLAIINGEECSEGTWTRIQKEKKSVLDYIITEKKDMSQIKKLIIDEEKMKTPYRINEDNDMIYTDHCMMILTTSLIVETKRDERKCITKKG